jgi:hypothetical protein
LLFVAGAILSAISVRLEQADLIVASSSPA